MSKQRECITRWLFLGLCAAVMLSTPVAAVAVQTIGAIPSGAARIWFYRDYEPYVSHNYATVHVNGAVAGSIDPYDGSPIYRDVPPGRYHLSVETYGTDVNQDVSVDLAAGQEVYVKVLNSPSWDNDVDISAFQRDTYYLRLVPPNLAHAEMAHR